MQGSRILLIVGGGIAAPTGGESVDAFDPEAG